MLSDPLDMRKKTIFLFFEIFIFTLFIGIFRFFPYITLIYFWFPATGHSFSPRNVIFGLREPCTIRNWRLDFFFNFIFYDWRSHFSDFFAIFQYNFGDFWDMYGMRPNFSKLSMNFYRTYERGEVDIDITMACDTSI